MSERVPIWTPTDEDTTLADFARWCVTNRGAPAAITGDYQALWRWSVDELAEFWGAVGEYFGVVGDGPVLVGDEMPGVRWFPGTTVNYVWHVFRDRPGDGVALIDVTESGLRRELTWADLARDVAAFAGTLRGFGVQAGDRVAGYLPNTAESVIAFLGTASIGAVWAACGQDYSPHAAAERFGQLEPVVLVAADGYRFGGRERSRSAEVAQLRELLPSVKHTVVVNRLAQKSTMDGVVDWAGAVAGDHHVHPAPVDFDHPLWVLFSSGTTGRPKGIVHGHGGVLLEHLKVLRLHSDLGPGDVFFWYTSPSWMVWNYLVSVLLVGATVVCYDGSPTHPGPDLQWALAAEHGVTFLGTSPGPLAAGARAGLEPARDHDLSALRAIGSSGSLLPADAYHWVAEHVGPHVQVVSTSGGTDVVSAFAGGAPNLPVWPGELSGPCLGVALEAWDADGHAVVGEQGELVVTKPMPSMPLRFWDDADGTRYREAYFSTYPGVWRHGDWITITERGSVVVHGRSDATLNRNGVRMGSADIHQVVEGLSEVDESLVIGAERPDGGYWMPLFVKTTGGVLDDALREKIRSEIKRLLSPRHVPDDIVAVPALPHTRTGKKLEVPVKRVLQGAPAADVADPGSVDDAGLLASFEHYRRTRTEKEQDS
ncbi:acetoacetate--CoA ligase [Amycolatopsis sp. NPDC005232]|uniref:acetoacetate--CoA ligase n=1 Tax=Amycolatopsis sp. NPDC005232 TaxID=3157027 RepID=UPI0033A00DA6